MNTFKIFAAALLGLSLSACCNITVIQGALSKAMTGPGNLTPVLPNPDFIGGPLPVIPLAQPMPDWTNSSANTQLLNAQSKAVTDGRISLLGLNLNNSGNVVIVKPGATVLGTTAYIYNCPQCKTDSVNQVIIGINNIGAQACISVGNTQTQGITDFQLTAPVKPGVYQIRFRYAQALDCDSALKQWWNMNNAPTSNATAGKIIVK